MPHNVRLIALVGARYTAATMRLQRGQRKQLVVIESLQSGLTSVDAQSEPLVAEQFRNAGIDNVSIGSHHVLELDERPCSECGRRQLDASTFHRLGRNDVAILTQYGIQTIERTERELAGRHVAALLLAKFELFAQRVDCDQKALADLCADASEIDGSDEWSGRRR